jgi:hypothetical protein
MAYRLVRSPVIHYGPTCYGTTCYGTTYYGTTYCGLTYYGSTYYGPTQYVEVMRDCKPGMLEYQLEACNHSKCSHSKYGP